MERETSTLIEALTTADFLLVVTSNKSEDDGSSDLRFHLNDSCAHCSKAISLEVRGGEITAMDPETVWFQQGGG